MFNTTINVTVDTAQGVSALERLSQATNRFDSDIGRADNKLREFERGIGSFRRAILGLQSAFLGFGAMNLVRDLIKVNLEFERVRFALMAGAKDAMVAAGDFNWLRQTTAQLGLPLNQLGLEYAKLTANAKGTALEGQPVRDVFLSVSKAAQGLGLDIGTTQRIFMALSQMLSKGRVQAEEARQQFGEHLPGGFKALAKAAGFDAVTGLGKFQQALSKGKVDAIDMLMNLPKVLDEQFGPAFEAALVSSPQMAVNRFKAMMANLAYDIGQAGFMKEFVGLIHDMGRALSSPDGRKEVERLGYALGVMMHAVRQVADFIMNNFNPILAATAGLISSYMVLGLKNMVGWLGRIVGLEGGLVGVLTNPWLLAAAAVGGAVFWVMRFGDEIVQMGNHQARGLDWVRGLFDVLSEDIERSALALEDWLSKFQPLNGILKGARDAVAAFQGALSMGLDSPTSLKIGADQFMVTLARYAPAAAQGLRTVLDTLSRAGEKLMQISHIIGDGLIQGIKNFGKAFEPAIKPLADLGQRLMGWLITPLGIAWNIVQSIANGATTWANYVAAALSLFGSAMGGAFANVAVAVTGAFNKILGVVGHVLGQINTRLNNTFNNGQQINWWKVLGAVALTALNVIVGAINGVGVAINFVTNLFGIFGRSIGPLIGQIATTLSDIIARITNSATVGQTAFGAFGVVLSAVYELIRAVVTSVVTLASLIARTLTPIIDGIGMAIEGVIMAVNGVLIGLSSFGKKAADEGAKVGVAMDTGKGKTNQWGSAFVKFGDVVVGVIVTAIQVVGLFIKIIGAAISALIQVLDRLDTVQKASVDWIQGLMTLNFEQVSKAGEEIRNALTKPLENIDTKGIMEDLGRDVSSNFHIVTDAVKDGAAAGNAFDKAAADLAKGFTQITPSAIQAAAPGIQDAANQLGQSEAEAYTNGFLDRWGEAAQARTQAYLDEKARIAKQQQEMAQLQAAAWAQNNANVDRSQRPDQMQTGRHGKSAAEKAQDKISELQARIQNLQELTAQLNLNPHQNPDNSKAYEAAQSALRGAGYDVSVGDAMSGKAGEIAKKLAQVAVGAQIAQKELDKAQKVADSIWNNDVAIKGMQDQLRLSKDVSLSTNEYNARLKAQDELRKNDIDMTFEQAMSLDANGKALDTEAYALASSTYQRELWNDAAKASVEVTAELRRYMQMDNELNQLTGAYTRGAGALNEMSAEIEAQHVVMQKYGDEVFDVTRLNDDNTRALYDEAKAWAQMGGSMQSVLQLMQDLKYQATAVTDPVAAERMRIQDEAATKRSQLDAFMQAATNTYGREMSDAMGSNDPAAGIDAAIEKYNAAREAYMEALTNLQTATNDELIRNSNNWQDAMRASFENFGKDAENIGGQLQDTFGKAFDGMADQLTNFVMTGKMDFRSLALSVIADIEKMIIKWLIWQTIKAASKFFFADGGVMTPSGASTGGGSVGADNTMSAPVSYAANGGIMTSMGMLPLQKYASGGIANRPQVAVFGEGRMNEAYVPLPDGRSIPVTLNMDNYHNGADTSGTAGMQANVHVETTIYVQNDGGGPGGNGRTNEDNQKMAETLSKKINAEFKNQVISVVADELRPGGVFNKMGANRSRF